MVAESPTVLYVTPAGLGSMPLTDSPSHIPRIDGATSGTTAAAGGDNIPPAQCPWWTGYKPECIGCVVAKLTNLLPSANPALRAVSGGVYVGNGLLLVPAKIAAKIYRGEFIDMGEVLPEFWSGLRD